MTIDHIAWFEELGDVHAGGRQEAWFEELGDVHAGGRQERLAPRGDAQPQAALEGHNLRTLVANHVLPRFPNVIVTPHNAYNRDSAVPRIIETTLANIEAFAGGEPRSVVSHG